MKIFVPPIKCQGIKTKLVEWIKEKTEDFKFEKWFEPFMGSGVVGFNVRPKNALFADINPHLVNFYNELKSNNIRPSLVRTYLENEGSKLSHGGVDYFLKVRERFNETFSPLDFLFLNRSSFNGIIRFNRFGKYNVPFGHKPNRFSKAYITKIVNQVEYVQNAMFVLNWEFKCIDFRDSLNSASVGDLAYCDPPYFGRHTDYFNSWSETDENDLFSILNKNDFNYILSTWHSNQYRKNESLEKFNGLANIHTREHFYHVGASESNRNSMLEALIINYDSAVKPVYNTEHYEALRLFEKKEKYE